MPKYMIERKVPGVGLGSEDQLRAMAKKSNDALHELNGEVLWLESFVTDDSTYCVYVAPNEELVRKHAEIAGFPADRISKVDTVIDPSTGELPTTARMTDRSKVSEQTFRQ